MNTSQNNFEQFVTGLVRKPIDPARLAKARSWYKDFAGKYAVVIDDYELIEIYEGLNG